MIIHEKENASCEVPKNGTRIPTRLIYFILVQKISGRCAFIKHAKLVHSMSGHRSEYFLLLPKRTCHVVKLKFYMHFSGTACCLQLLNLHVIWSDEQIILIAILYVSENLINNPRKG